jgi:hypothetical protein
MMTSILYYITDGPDRTRLWVAAPITKTTKRHYHITVSCPSLGAGEHEATIPIETIQKSGSARATIKDGTRRSIEVFDAGRMLIEKAWSLWGIGGVKQPPRVSYAMIEADVIDAACAGDADPTAEMIQNIANSRSAIEVTKPFNLFAPYQRRDFYGMLAKARASAERRGLL